MAFIRWIVGKIILFLDALTSPRGPERSREAQEKIDALTAPLAVYQFAACPFCVKVRRFLKSEGIKLELRDAKSEPWRTELLKEGGKLQVPCLRIPREDGSVRWMYESRDIIAHLENHLQLSKN